ncbi:helix-turn-helix domain-containing protein [Spongiimicrobium salis]|uniref:helix-turn-helix domain-containing protein n=1 Tax=Spongiimicrobium salis TaxID=1667022 RepID=UPI00374D8923
MEATITFEQLPSAIVFLTQQVKELKELLLQKEPQQYVENKPISIKEASALTGLSVQTLYGYCHRSEIPYHKKGNRLYFFKTELIDWIKEGRSKTLKELNNEADVYLSQKRSA